MKRHVLVVIDCQNDFITGALRNEEAIKNNPVLLDQARESYENSIVSDAEDTLQGLGIKWRY